MLSGLQVLAALVQTGQPASALLSQFDPVPQMLKNVRYGAGQDPLNVDAVKSAEAEKTLEGRGRLLIRSRALNLIRVAECDNGDLLERTVDSVVDAAGVS